jgi:hypothetical protein
MDAATARESQETGKLRLFMQALIALLSIRLTEERRLGGEADYSEN